MGLDVANLLLKISGEPDDAKRALSEITAELRKFGTIDEQAKIGVAGYDEAKEKISSLERSLTVLGQRDVTAKVKINVDEAKARLAQLRRELDLSASGGAGALPGKEIFSEIDNVGNSLERSMHSRLDKIGQDAKRFFKNIGTDLVGTLKGALAAGVKGAGNVALSGVGAIIQGAGDVGKGIVSLGASAVGSIGPLGALLGVLLLFAPALLALVASLAGAAAGFSVLAVSFVGVLAPAVLLLLGAVKELTQAWSAVTKQQEKAKASALAIAQANQNIHSSTERLAAAQKNLREQTANAYEAWRAQIRTVREDLLGVQQAQLGIQSSELQYKQSLQSLKEFRNSIGLGGGKFDDLFKKFTNVDFDPSKILKSIKDAGGGELGHKQDLELQQLIIAVKEAKLGESQAQNSLHSSNEKLEKDRRIEAKYLKEGIKAYPGYISALKEVRTAQEGLTTSERALAKAQLAAAAPSSVTKEQLALGAQLHSFVNELKKLFGPAVSEIFKGLETGLKSVISLFKDSGLSSAFKELGRTIGSVFAQLGKTLASPEVRRGLTELVKGSSNLVKTLGSQILINFIRLFTNLAVAAMPAMLRIVRSIGDAFKRWADGSSNVTALRSKISHIIGEFESWMKLIGALARLLKAFFHDTAAQGDSLAHSITKLFEKWTKFLETKAGQEEVKKFFKEAIELAKDFIHIVKDVIDIVKALTEVFEPVVEGIQSVGSYLGDRYNETSPSSQFIEGQQAAQKGQQQKTIDSVNSQLKKGKTTHGETLTPAVRKRLEELRANAERELHPKGHTFGGLIGSGWGGGDRIPINAENGEYMLRKEVVNSVGRAALDRLNATGHFHTSDHTGKGDTIIDKIILPPAPGGEGFDPRTAAVKLGKELSRRGLG